MNGESKIRVEPIPPTGLDRDEHIRLTPQGERIDSTDEVFEFRMGQVWRLLEVAEDRGCSVYDLVLATDLTVQGVLDAVWELQRNGLVVRPRLDYERNLELIFILRGIRQDGAQ